MRKRSRSRERPEMRGVDAFALAAEATRKSGALTLQPQESWTHRDMSAMRA